MDELTLPLKRGLVDLIFGIYGNVVEEVVDSLEAMDVIRKVPYGSAWYHLTWYGVMWYDMVRVWYGMVWCCVP